MENFDEFELLLAELKPITKTKSERECVHFPKESENGLITCMSCGEELSKNVMYISTDIVCGKISSSLNTKASSFSIENDIRDLILNNNIKSRTLELYLQTTNRGQIIHRAKYRRLLIFACIYMSFLEIGKVENKEDLFKFFNISRRDANLGIKKLKIAIPSLRQVSENIQTYLENFTKKFNIFQHYDSIYDFYLELKPKCGFDEIIKPKIIAALIVYIWVKKELGFKISIKEYIKECDISYAQFYQLHRQILKIYK